MTPNPNAERDEPLTPVLQRVMQELERDLLRACDAVEHGSTETTGEMLKLSKTLDEAALKARAAVAIRARLKQRQHRAQIADRLSDGSEGPAR